MEYKVTIIYKIKAENIDKAQDEVLFDTLNLPNVTVRISGKDKNNKDEFIEWSE